MSITRLTALLLVLITMAVGCSGPAGEPTTDGSAPGTSTQGSTSAPSSASVPAPGDTVFSLKAGSSEARYSVREQLAGQSLPGDAIGATKSVSGSITIGLGGVIVQDRSKITVGLLDMKSDDSRRDNFLRRNTLQTGRFPNAEFAAKQAEGLAWPLPSSGELTFKLIGDLTVRDITRTVTWDVTARVNDTGIAGNAFTSLKFADFNLTQPRVFLVVSLEDAILLEIDFDAVKQ